MIFARIMKKNLKSRVFNFFKKKYRLVILNNKNLEEYFSFSISNSLLFLLFFVFLVLGSFVLNNSFTVADVSKKEILLQENLDLLKSNFSDVYSENDSLYSELATLSLYNKCISIIWSGGVPSEEMMEKLKKSDSILKLYNNSFSKQNINSGNLEFFPPVSGVFTEGYSKSHFGVDIVTKKNAFVHAVDDGLVFFSDCSKKGGFVIAVVHQNNFISVYKHNQKTLKSVGDFVKIGEPIGVVGNTGELTSGDHLHFELWRGMKNVDPTNFIMF